MRGASLLDRVTVQFSVESHDPAETNQSKVLGGLRSGLYRGRGSGWRDRRGGGESTQNHRDSRHRWFGHNVVSVKKRSSWLIPHTPGCPYRPADTAILGLLVVLSGVIFSGKFLLRHHAQIKAIVPRPPTCCSLSVWGIIPRNSTLKIEPFRRSNLRSKTQLVLLWRPQRRCRARGQPATPNTFQTLQSVLQHGLLFPREYDRLKFPDKHEMQLVMYSAPIGWQQSK